jgi:CRP-like cAMP-binding protein
MHETQGREGLRLASRRKGKRKTGAAPTADGLTRETVWGIISIRRDDAWQERHFIQIGAIVSVADTEITGVKNKLLAALDPDAFARVAKHLIPVTLKVRQVLYKPGQHIHEVFFPEDAVIVLLAVDDQGRTIESGTVGREGASWISASVSAPSMPCETIVAIEGRAHKLAIEGLEAELDRNDQFRDVLTQYSHALLVSSMRTTGCVGLHDVSQRCARWMLHTLDRVSGNRFIVTHELLSMLMGTTRPTISLIVQTFEKAGIVDVERGAITVVDRARLEAVSCECYRIIKRHFDEIGPLRGE